MGKKFAALLTILAIIFTVVICTPDSNAGIQTLNLSKQTKEIKVGESFQLTMTGVKASSIKWKSSKPGVATISKKGVVKGIKTGTTNITGKYKSLKFTIKVNVITKATTTDNTTENTTEDTKSDKILLGSCSNVDIYYITVEKNEKLILEAVNKNNQKMYVYLDYINMDGKTASLRGSNVVSANDTRTMEWYDFDNLITPKKTITGLIEINDSSYNKVGEIEINVTLK